MTTLKEPSKPSKYQPSRRLSSSERVWDGLAGGAGWLLRLPLLPFVAVGRAWSGAKHSDARSAIRADYRLIRYQQEQASRLPVEFLARYLAQLKDIHNQYYNANFTSVAEAEQGYQLMLAAKAALLTQAKKEIANLSQSSKTNI